MSPRPSQLFGRILRAGLSPQTSVLGLALLSGLALARGRVSPIDTSAQWPSISHPLGVDSMGRDFLHVVATGTLDFAVPGLVSVLVLVAVAAIQSLWTVSRPPLSAEGAEGTQGGAWLLLAAPPRLLLVMIGMLFLEEPNPWVAAGIVTALYLPLSLDECGATLRNLRQEQVLAGAIAHGLSTGRLVGRHLLGGHLRLPLLRHAATLFTQVAFTQIALAYIFGASAVSSGLSVSWGMEFRRLVARLPSPGLTFCEPGVVCEPQVAALQCAFLVGASLLLLGGLLRGAGPKVGGAPG